ncbi:MAG: tRNA uridine-5-carboxymethylaminomethyl(34) synthesis GTPase MnmE [Bacteroidota bacterium]
MNKISGWKDTIVAPATAPGIAAIGVIRVSGPDAINLVNHLFPNKDLTIQKTHTLHFGTIQWNGEIIDEVLISLFKAPKSYTGENTVEISGHGSPYVMQQILQALVANGARMAKHGEFTQRAFINGKLDLTQAESVADLIVANTQSAQRFAIHNLRGGFSVQLKKMREQLIQFASLIELELDFATEDVEFADRARFHTLINDIEKVIIELIASFQLGNVVKNGVSVAIIGKPNAGKSTLLNALLKEERAIVSEIAGTTRDTIEETLNIDGVLHRIIDTAGIRENSIDQIENIGIERSLEKMRTADLVIYLFDVHTETNLDLEHRKKKFEEDGIAYLLVANKCDGEGVDQSENDDEIIRISAKHELGIEHLKRSMFEKTVGTLISNDQTVVTNARHLESLQNMSQSILQIKQGLLQQIPGDLLSIEIRSCLFHLGEITGEVTSEDKLDYIFSKFCIGK